MMQTGTGAGDKILENLKRGVDGAMLARAGD